MIVLLVVTAYKPIMLIVDEIGRDVPLNTKGL